MANNNQNMDELWLHHILHGVANLSYKVSANKAFVLFNKLLS